jgi:rubrerythrin
MAYAFNANEMLDLAIRIEENGGRFYRKAAQLQSDPENQALLDQLATMEAHHKLTFETMKKGLSEAGKTATVFDPLEESGQYLAAMADAHGGEGSPAIADTLTGKESIVQIIDIAIGLEKESILFYLGLKDMVPPEYGQEKLDQIIREEQRHLTQLSALRKKFRGKGL